jgi:hypothetical protein
MMGGTGAYLKWHYLRDIGKITNQELKLILGKKQNPQFFEWMMGFPLDWTHLEVEPVETP